MTHAQEIRAQQDEVLDRYVDGKVASATQSLAVALRDTESRLAEKTGELTSVTDALADCNRNRLDLTERISGAGGYEELVADLQRQVTALSAEVDRLKGVPTSPAVRPANGYPTVDFEDIREGAEDIDATLWRLDQQKRKVNVRLKAGLYEFSNFKYAVHKESGQAYGILSTYCVGLQCDDGRAIIQMRPMSSDKGSWVPAQGSGKTNNLTTMRIGDSQSAINSWGIILSQTEQGHHYNGWSDYRNQGGETQDCLVTGGSGDWNSPPGETFSGWNSYRCEGSIHRRCEYDGFTYVYKQDATGTSRVKGERKGGSPFGNNASNNIQQIDCNFHDSYVSGVTGSFTSDPITGAAPHGWTTEDCTFRSNANHEGNKSGKTFTGINHEGVLGKVHHIRPVIDQIHTTMESSHCSFAGAQEDNADITITDPTYTTGPNWAAGCFAVSMPRNYYWKTNADGSRTPLPSKQVTPPKVIRDGVTLTPLRWNDKQPRLSGLDPQKVYVIKE